MRIAVTHPSCWPYVRRGAERFFAELSRYLSLRGHDVVTLSSKPGWGRTEKNATGTHVVAPQFWWPGLRRLRLEPSHCFVLPAYFELRRREVDVVQSLHYADALASLMAARHADHRTIYYVTGPPVPAYVPRIPPDRWMLREAIRRADHILVPSEYVARIVEQHYRRKAQILPVPIDTEAFAAPSSKRPERPVLLGMAAFDDRRKGGQSLLEAFVRLKRQHRDALLRISGQMSPGLRSELMAIVPQSMRDDVEFLGAGELGDLPRVYAEASVTVVPAKWESYGLVVLESWACGTPVVAAAHGALPELFADRQTGVLFDPGEGPEATNVEGLAAAIEQGLSLSQRPQTASRCRQKAEDYSWGRLGPEYERVYERVLTANGNLD